jgi:hypothetical protein
MKQEIYNKFHAYLCDVVKHYRENKSLRNFSKLATKHGCTHITSQQFFEHGLHQLPCEVPPMLSYLIYDSIVADKRYKRKERERSKMQTVPSLPLKRFHDGEVVAWVDNRGLECIAVVDENGWYNYGYNIGKHGGIYYCEEVPENITLVEPSAEMLKRFLSELAKECWEEHMNNPKNELHFEYEKSIPTL